MSGHNAVAVRRADGWIRWYAECPTCGWQKLRAGGKEGAEKAAQAHNEKRSR